jgi:hypothetical protein
MVPKLEQHLKELEEELALKVHLDLDLVLSQLV